MLVRLVCLCAAKHLLRWLDMLCVLHCPRRALLLSSRVGAYALTATQRLQGQQLQEVFTQDKTAKSSITPTSKDQACPACDGTLR